MLKPYWSAKSLSRQLLHAPRESLMPYRTSVQAGKRTVVAWRFLWRGGSCTTPISKEERHISDRFLCHTLVQCKHCSYLAGRGSKYKGGARTGTHWDKTNCFAVNENWNLVHQALPANLAGTMLNMCERLVPPRGAAPPPPLKRRHSLKPALDSGLWTQARKVCAARLVMVFEGLHSTTNDPKNGPQMIRDRKWSPMSSANDPKRNRKLEWLGLKIIKIRKKIDFANKKAKKKVITVKLHLKLCSINETIVNANKK